MIKKFNYLSTLSSSYITATTWVITANGFCLWVWNSKMWE